MTRVIVVASLLLGLALGGCDTFFPSSGGSQAKLTGLDPDGGVCTKDPQAIKNVMLAPPLCNATTPCICGTFCSSNTGGNCVADCFDDTWCAPGYSCSGYGQCLPSGPDGGAPAGSTTDPACPRNETLLNSLTTMRRACEFDDACPYGSHCNRAAGWCEATCRSDAYCAGMADGGQTLVCSCLGTCVEVAAPRTPPRENLPSLEVTPRQYMFPRPAATVTSSVWGDENVRFVNVALVSPFVTTSGTTIVGPRTVVQVKPGPGLMVASEPSGNPAEGGRICVEGGTASAMPCQITIEPSDLRNRGDVYRSSTSRVRVAPSPEDPTATKWSLRFDSDGLTTPVVVDLRYEDEVVSGALPNYLTATLPDPTFRGVGTIELSTPTGGILTIPVKARYYNNDLVFWDETRQLSPSGTLALHVGNRDGYMQTFLDTSLDNDRPLQGVFESAVLQRVTGYGMERDTVSGALQGRFSRAVLLQGPDPAQEQTVELDLNATFTLSRIADSGEFCDPMIGCPGGATCDMGFCTRGPLHQFATTSDRNNREIFRHKRMSAWGWHWSVNNDGFRGIYLPHSGYYSLPNPSTPYFPSVWNGTVSPHFELQALVPPVSGEPLAKLVSSEGGLIEGDLRPLAIPLLTQHDGSWPQTASQLLAACLSDLSRNRSTPISSTFGVEPTTHDPEVYDTYGTCINLGRVGVALGDPRTFQRTLQGWLNVHSFVAREGLEEIQLKDAAGLDLPPDASPPTFDRLLTTTESGLGLLFDITTGMSSLVLAAWAPTWDRVDYRPAALEAKTCNGDSDCNKPGNRTMSCQEGVCRLLGLNELPHHEQPVGLPSAVLEAATSYVKLLEAYVGKIARETYGQPADASPSNARAAALARYGLGMRLVLAAEQVAARFKTLAGACPSGYASNCLIAAQRYEAARTELETARTRVAAQAEAIRTAGNPFNIPDDDVPLFFGDATGKNSRYFAASDYLLNGWAAPAVTRAQSYLDSARASWLSQLNARVQDELNQHNREQEINQLMSRYGSPILANCGAVEVWNGSDYRSLDSTEIVPYYSTNPQPFDNARCHVKQSCIGNPNKDPRAELRRVINRAFLDEQGAFVTGRDNAWRGGAAPPVASFFVQSEVCKVTYLARRLMEDPYIQMLSNWCPGYRAYDRDNPGAAVSGAGCIPYKGTDGNLYFGQAAGGSAARIPLAALYGPIRRDDIGQSGFYREAVDGPFGADNIYNYRDFRTDERKASSLTSSAPGTGFRSVERGTVAQVLTVDAAKHCSSGLGGRLFKDYPRPMDDEFPGSCYRGAMGVAFHQGKGSLLRVERAKQVLENGRGALDDTFSQCSHIDANSAYLMERQQRFDDMKGDYETAMTIGNFIVDSGMAIGGALAGNPGAALGGGNPLVGLVNGLIANAIAEEERKLKALEKRFAAEERSQDCWNGFRAARRALATAMADIQIAATELDAQGTLFRNMGDENLANLREGIAVLAREKASPVSSLSHHFWINEKVDQFKKEMEWARRLTFLAMRAVEYEFQQSLPFRSEIVAATTPAQLEDVVRGLQQQQAARTVNRRRPEEASVVVSLRDDVLAIRDRSHELAGERNWTPAQRFASRLWEDRWAMRDGDGNYLGQAIPFTLGPTGVLETRCGERLWRATATLQGDGIEDSAPGAPVLLLKRNTFSSQYCNGKAPPISLSDGTNVAGPSMQTGVVHTAAQLFQPGPNVDLSDANQFTAAMLYPWFNVRRTDFYKTTYQDGASEELAGRGLYGDYVLLFPKQVLDQGLALDKVEDVLLRLDYLSVDNLSQ